MREQNCRNFKSDHDDDDDGAIDNIKPVTFQFSEGFCMGGVGAGLENVAA